MEDTHTPGPDVAASLEAARDLIRAKAHALARRPGFKPQDVDDISQALVLRLLKRLGSFDPAVASLETFVQLILDQGGASLIRDRHAAVRYDPDGASLDAVVAGPDGGHALAADVTAGDAARRLGAAPRGDQGAAELRHDLDAFLASLTLTERARVEAFLRHGNLRAAAAELGIAPQTLGGSLRRLRARAGRLGLGEYLAIPPSVRPAAG